MGAYGHTQHFSPRLWLALATTVLTFVVSLLASLNLYLLEDDNPLTAAAYSASPLLRFSYTAAYLTALVAAIAICAILAYSLLRRGPALIISLSVVALLVALGGFGGLLIRSPTTFLVLLLVFAALDLLCLLSGRAVTAHTRHLLGPHPAAILGACVSTSIALLLNVVAVVAHTLTLNPVSHTLFMQGQIGATHFNSLVIAMGFELLTVFACLLSIWLALRAPAQSA